MIITLLIPLLASSTVLAARFNATLPARECTTHNNHTTNATNEQPVPPVCSGNTPSYLETGRTIQTIKGPYSTPDPTTYARSGGIERRLMRTFRPVEELVTRPFENSATTTTTNTSISTANPKTKTTRTIAPVEERSFLPIGGVPTYTIKPKPTVMSRVEARETPAIEKRSIRLGDDKSTVTPTTATLTKTKTRTRTTRTIVPIEGRSFLPIDDAPTFTINLKPTKTKTKKGTRTPTLVPIEEGKI